MLQICINMYKFRGFFYKFTRGNAGNCAQSSGRKSPPPRTSRGYHGPGGVPGAANARRCGANSKGIRRSLSCKCAQAHGQFCQLIEGVLGAEMNRICNLAGILFHKHGYRLRKRAFPRDSGNSGEAGGVMITRRAGLSSARPCSPP